MKRLMFAFLVASLAGLCAAADESYLGACGALTLPQGGARLRRVGGAALRAGTYVTESCALEASAAVQENAAGLGVGALCHWSAWETYDRFFGFSAFDPFLTLGARGWMASPAGQVGPSTGLGAFYHLTDRWSLRCDADVTLGLDTRVETLFTVSAGVQFFF